MKVSTHIITAWPIWLAVIDVLVIISVSTNRTQLCHTGITVCCYSHKKYRVTSVLKVEKDIITSITRSPIQQATILVIMYVMTFKTDVTMCLKSHRPIFFSIGASLLILEISLSKIKGKMHKLQINYYTSWQTVNTRCFNPNKTYF